MVNSQDLKFDLYFQMPILKPLPMRTKKFTTRWQRAKAWWLDRRKFQVIYDWEFPITEELSIHIPQGYVFDGASIPRILWWLASPTGLLLIPALVHDYGYGHDSMLITSSRVGSDFVIENKGRKFWDALFVKMSLGVNDMRVISWGSYFVLRAFGWLMWLKFKRIREKGV